MSDNNKFKLPKLKKATDEIHWQGRVKAYLHKDDYALVSLKDLPEQVAHDVLQAWKEKRAKAKSIVIVPLGYAVMDKTGTVVNDHTKYTKCFWEVIRRLHPTFNYQAITNLINRLKSPLFVGMKEHSGALFSKIMKITDELGTYDKGIINEKNKTKLVRTLPKSFKPIARVCNVTHMYCNHVVDVMNTES